MDKFDDIWRNKFQQEDPQPDQWNTPSDKAWESIAAGIRIADRRKKILPILLLFLLFGFLGLMFIVGLKTGIFSPENNKILSDKENQADQIYTSQNEGLIVLQDFSDTHLPESKKQEKALPSSNNNQLYSESSTITDASDIIDEEYQHPDGNFKKSKELPFKNQQFPESERIINDLNNNLDEKKSGFDQRDGMFHNDLKVENKFDVENISGKENGFPLFINEKILPTRESKVPTNPISLYPKNELLLTAKNKPSAVKSNYWSAGFYVSPFLWQQNLSQSYTELLEPFEFNYSKISFGIRMGVDVNRKLNESFELYLQPGYSIISGTSGHNSTLVYSISEETQDNHSNSYNIDMATPFGFAAADFQLIRKDEIATQEVELNPVFESDFSIHAISIPIGLRYYPLKSCSFNPYINTGLTFNQILTTENKLTEVRPNHNAFDSKTIKGRKNISNNLRKSNLNINLGIGSSFYLRDHIKLNINYQYAYAVGSINISEINSNRTQSHELIFSVLKKIDKN